MGRSVFAPPQPRTPSNRPLPPSSSLPLIVRKAPTHSTKNPVSAPADEKVAGEESCESLELHHQPGAYRATDGLRGETNAWGGGGKLMKI